MRKARLAIGLALVIAALPVAPAEAKLEERGCPGLGANTAPKAGQCPRSSGGARRYTCGNYGYPEGHRGDRPVFTREPIVGAGVEAIRTRELRCRKARPMVRAFWNGRFDCNENGTRCTYFTFTCRNRRLGDEYWAMRCAAPNGRLLAFRFGA